MPLDIATAILDLVTARYNYLCTPAGQKEALQIQADLAPLDALFARAVKQIAALFPDAPATK